MKPEIILQLIIRLTRISNGGEEGKGITTLRQAITLLAIYTRPSIAMRHIVKMFKTERSSISMVIKRYVKAGLIVNEDGKLFLTERGMDIIESFEDDAEKIVKLLQS